MRLNQLYMGVRFRDWVVPLKRVKITVVSSRTISDAAFNAIPAHHADLTPGDENNNGGSDSDCVVVHEMIGGVVTLQGTRQSGRRLTRIARAPIPPEVKALAIKFEDYNM